MSRLFEIDFFSMSSESVAQLAGKKIHEDVEDWEKQIWQFIVDWLNPDITTLQVFTSGSTGAPKAITHTKLAMINSAAATCTALQLEPGYNALLCLPVSKIAGMMMVVRSIYGKMKLVCIRPSSTPFNSLPDELKIDFAAFTPMQFYEVIASRSSYNKANKMDKIILGGEDLRLESIHFIRELKSEVYTTFGMTETISHIALKRINGDSPDANFKVLPGIHISVDGRNCLVVEAPSLGQPRLVTNDVINLVNENEFQWRGRVDNVVNSGGVKIQPEEIERQLLGLLYAPYFVGSIPDALTGEKLVLAIEKQSLTDAEKSELTTAFDKLEKIQRPKQVLLIPKFVRTENGKIKRKESLLSVSQAIDLQA